MMTPDDRALAKVLLSFAWRETIHVLPIKDLREHDETVGCWCEPHIEIVGEDGRVIVHDALDGRE